MVGFAAGDFVVGILIVQKVVCIGRMGGLGLRYGLGICLHVSGCVDVVVHILVYLTWRD